jgi:hypothetical protein
MTRNSVQSFVVQSEGVFDCIQKVNEEGLMNKQEFHKIADDLLEGFAVKIEEQLEDLVEDMDVSYSVRQLCEVT